MFSSTLNFKYPISVVMSCYNSGRWLHEAIESVLGQVFQHFEFILVDDGSSDETWSIIKSYHAQDKRIIAISKKHSGLADSLNAGIAQASGKWIARLDADDLWESTRLQEQIEFVEQHQDVVLVGSGCIEIDEEGGDIRMHMYPHEHRELVRHLERSQRFFPHSSALFRRVIAQQAGSYNPFFLRSQDRDLWLRIAERGKLACVDNCLVKVRKHTEQMSHSATGSAQLVYGNAAAACHFLRVNNLPDPSNTADDRSWDEFLKWVHLRVMEEGVHTRRRLWGEARASYFSAGNRVSGTIRFGTRLLQSGQISAFLWDKVFGSSLPQRLAWEWWRRSCAAL